VSLEQEIKLQITTHDKIDISILPWSDKFVVGDIETSHLISTYFDTPKLYLMNHNVGLRLRQSGGVWFQTVKNSGTVKDGLHQRDEWEYELNSAEFDLEKLKQTPLKEMMADPEIWPNLITVFTTDFIRQTIQLSLPNNTQIELAYDRGEITAGNKVQVIHEIELELKTGSINELTQLAVKVSALLPVEYSDVSKAKLGYQMLTGLASR